jgi:hypothetical protein
VGPERFMEGIRLLFKSSVVNCITSFQGLGPKKLASGYEDLQLSPDLLYKQNSASTNSPIRTMAIKHIEKYWPELRGTGEEDLRSQYKDSQYAIDVCQKTYENVSKFRTVIQDIPEKVAIEYLNAYNGNVDEAVSFVNCLKHGKIFARPVASIGS